LAARRCPAFTVIKAADEFKDKTTAPNQLWQTDFTYLKEDLRKATLAARQIRCLNLNQ
jgi:hypothetical protein